MEIVAAIFVKNTNEVKKKLSDTSGGLIYAKNHFRKDGYWQTHTQTTISYSEDPPSSKRMKCRDYKYHFCY